MTAGYDLSTSWSQHFHQISLENPEETQGNKRDFRVVSVCCLPQFFHLSVLFNRSISRHVSDEFPMNFRCFSRRISTVYNHGMVLVFG